MQPAKTSEHRSAKIPRQESMEGSDKVTWEEKSWGRRNEFYHDMRRLNNQFTKEHVTREKLYRSADLFGLQKFVKLDS